MTSSTKGHVYLVGGGPGDPGLITAKAMACIAAADAVVYDYLAARRLLTHARPDSEKIYVGKKGGDHTMSQERINQLLVDLARQGKVVCRLKGGDPFIFGRGGEEAEVLAQNGIEFEIVPGVTSAIAAPAYAGIPLTHRKFTSTVAFVTGHEEPGKADSAIDWPSLAKGIGTLVFLMGIKNLEKITTRLRQAGKPADTPAAVVRWGTTSAQQTVTGTLADIADKVRRAGIKAPAVVVVGQVVSLRPTLSWFERRPLLGKTVIVTRSRAQASDLIQRLEDLGAACIELPTIRTEPPETWQPVDEAIAQLHAFDWVVFTSVNGVDAFFNRLMESGRDARALAGAKLAAIGPATAARLQRWGLRCDLVPETYRAESVVAAFAGSDLAGKRVLLPRAKEARQVLPEQLAAMGAAVTDVAVYRTVAEEADPAVLTTVLENEPADVITFTSSSTVTNFHRLLQQTGKQLAAATTVACIGPVTAETATRLGFRPDIVADTYTIEGLCRAIVGHLAPGAPPGP